MLPGVPHGTVDALLCLQQWGQRCGGLVLRGCVQVMVFQ